MTGYTCPPCKSGETPGRPNGYCRCCTTEHAEHQPEPPVAPNRCPECRRLLGIGCSCGLTFAEKIKGVGATVPKGFGYR